MGDVAALVYLAVVEIADGVLADRFEAGSRAWEYERYAPCQPADGAKRVDRLRGKRDWMIERLVAAQMQFLLDPQSRHLPQGRARTRVRVAPIDTRLAKGAMGWTALESETAEL